MRIRRRFALLGVGALAFGAVAVLGVTLRPNGVVVPAQAQGGPSVALDMNIDNGSGPCNPIDATRGVSVGDTFQVAVCLTNSPVPPAALQFNLAYDRTINQCVPSDCTGTTCLDSNPDANAGATIWGSSLGPGWDCNVLQMMPPSCDQSGAATISCLTMVDGALPVGTGVSAPVAVVTFKAAAEGTDTLSLGYVTFGASDNSILFTCPDPGVCAPGSVTTTAVGAPTATAASTEVSGGATAAATAGTVPSVRATPASTAQPASASEEGGGSSGPNAGIIAAIVVVGIVLVGSAGWLTWRRLRAS